MRNSAVPYLQVPEGNIYGIRNGFPGFYDHSSKPVILTARSVDGIQLKGGTVLGTCKEAADLGAVVDRIKLWGINMLFVIGGDGSERGSQAADPCSQDHITSLHTLHPSPLSLQAIGLPRRST